MSRHEGNNKNEQGFTIIELLIATTVLSVILLLVSVMMVNIGRLYFKGINQARIQDNARSITDEVAQHVEFNNDAPSTLLSQSSNSYGSYTANIDVYCIGSVRYTFILGHQIGSDSSMAKQQIPHVLWRDTITPPSCPTDANLTHPDPSSGSSGSDGSELIAPNSQLTDFTITENPLTHSPYQVKVGVAYGDYHLLTGNLLNTKCVDNTGDDFCATASLETTVGKRL